MFGRKRYYVIIKFIGAQMIKQVWHCTPDTVALLNYDFLIPLDRKPRNVEIREG
jgi:hypothetical protein